LEVKHQLKDFLPSFNDGKVLEPNLSINGVASSHQSQISKTIKCMYDIQKDDSFYRHYMANSASFSEIRSNYPIRREWPAAKLKINDKGAALTLQKLGFKLANDSK